MIPDEREQLISQRITRGITQVFIIRQLPPDFSHRFARQGEAVGVVH